VDCAGVGFDLKTQPNLLKWVWIRTHKWVGPDPKPNPISQNPFRALKGIVAGPDLDGLSDYNLNPTRSTSVTSLLTSAIGLTH